MGEAKIARTWAMAVPPTSLKTSDAKDGVELVLDGRFLTLSTLCIPLRTDLPPLV